MAFNAILFFSLGVVFAEGTQKSGVYFRVNCTALTDLFQTNVVSSKQECCNKCTVTEGCNSVTYKAGTKECGLSSTKLADIENSSVSDADSVVYGKPGTSII